MHHLEKSSSTVSTCLIVVIENIRYRCRYSRKAGAGKSKQTTLTCSRIEACSACNCAIWSTKLVLSLKYGLQLIEHGSEWVQGSREGANSIRDGPADGIARVQGDSVPEVLTQLCDELYVQTNLVKLHQTLELSLTEDQAERMRKRAKET